MSDASNGPIVVAGAGSIGCFLGGLLADAGRAVVLLAPSRIIADTATHGLHLTSIERLDRRVSGQTIQATGDPAALARAACVLVAVKSTDTAAMAELIARHAPPAATIVSLQNVVDNVPLLRERLPGRKVPAGLVAFNVVSMGNPHFHKASPGTSCWSRMPKIPPPSSVCRGLRSHPAATCLACNGENFSSI